MNIPPIKLIAHVTGCKHGYTHPCALCGLDRIATLEMQNAELLRAVRAIREAVRTGDIFGSEGGSK